MKITSHCLFNPPSFQINIATCATCCTPSWRIGNPSRAPRFPSVQTEITKYYGKLPALIQDTQQNDVRISCMIRFIFSLAKQHKQTKKINSACYGRRVSGTGWSTLSSKITICGIFGINMEFCTFFRGNLQVFVILTPEHAICSEHLC